MSKTTISIICIIIVNVILAYIGYLINLKLPILNYTFATTWGAIILLIDLGILEVTN